jgi:hypothetical protein
MSDVIQYPTDLMKTKAQSILSDNSSLTDTTNTYMQQIQQYHASLPSAMQAGLQDFISTMQQHLSTGLSLHQHIGTLLGQAAESGVTTDTNNAQGFQES